MQSPAEGHLRRVRAAILTVAVFGLSSAAHTAGGGPLPSWHLLAVLTLLVAVPCWFLARARLSAPAILLVMAAGQTLMHVCLSALHQHSEGDHGADGGTASHHCSGPVMWLGHVAAAFALTALLAHAEGALWRMWRRLVAPVWRCLSSAYHPADSPRQGPVHCSRLQPGLVLLRANSLRGPPRVLVW